MTAFTIPGLSEKDGNEVAELLQKQLSTYNDLHLTSNTFTGMWWGPTSSVCTR